MKTEENKASTQQRTMKWYPLIPICAVFLLIGAQLIYAQLHEKADPAYPVNVADLTQLPKDPDGLIRLPLRIHLITDIELEKKKVKMHTWVTPEEIRKTLLPEINRIWKPAGIEWTLESIVVRPAAKVTAREEAITIIENAKRTAKNKTSLARTSKITDFCDKKNQHQVINNLNLFPYLGQTFQGFARMKGNFAVVGVWTDKPSHGKLPPMKFALVEKGEFKIGSLARTCAHELGHNLGLGHPDKKTQKLFNRVMGGRKKGSEFIPEEIALARKTAKKRAKTVLEWASKQQEK